MYVNTLGQWGFLGGSRGSISDLQFLQASLGLFVVFADRATATKCPYIQLEANGGTRAMVGLSVLLTADFHFLGFQRSCGTPGSLSTFFSRPSSTAPPWYKISPVPAIFPTSQAIVGEVLNYTDLLRSAPSLFAAGAIAAASSSKPSGDVVNSTTATAMAAGAVASPLFVMIDPNAAGNSSGSVDPGLPYKDPSGRSCVAQIAGGSFLIAANNDFLNATRDRRISIQDTTGNQRYITLNANGDYVPGMT